MFFMVHCVYVTDYSLVVSDMPTYVPLTQAKLSAWQCHSLTLRMALLSHAMPPATSIQKVLLYESLCVPLR